MRSLVTSGRRAAESPLRKIDTFFRISENPLGFSELRILASMLQSNWSLLKPNDANQDLQPAQRLFVDWKVASGRGLRPNVRDHRPEWSGSGVKINLVGRREKWTFSQTG